MTIGICDDEEIIRWKLKRICNQLLVERDICCGIMEFRNGMELMNFTDHLEILILDIEMAGIGGIEVKNRLQRMKRYVIIIYVTSHDEMIWEAFGLNVLGFVKKENMEQELPIMLTSALEMVGHFVVLRDDIDSREIAYIHTEQVYCRVFLVDATEKVLRIPIRELERELEGIGFIRVHRSYLVNLQYVEAVDDSMVYVLSQKIPISVRKRLKGQKACKMIGLCPNKETKNDAV